MTFGEWFRAVILPGIGWVIIGAWFLLMGHLAGWFRRSGYLSTWLMAILIIAATTLTPVIGVWAFMLALTLLISWLAFHWFRGARAR